MTSAKQEVVDATHKTEHFFGYDAQPGTPRRALGCARFVMFISAIGFAFLLGSLLGYRWLDIEYDQPGGGDPDIETDVHVGLYWTQSVIPTTNAFTGDEVPFISFQVTDNALFVANSYNQAGNNAGPVENDEDINDTAGALMILAVISVLVGFVLIPSAFGAHKEDMGHTCIAAIYGLAGAMLILAAIFAVASVLVFGGSDLREAFCWRYEDQPVADSGLDGAHCNYGASFYAAILGALFCALAAILLFALVHPSDIEWVRRQESVGNLDAAPKGAAETSEMEKVAVAEAQEKEHQKAEAAAVAESKENPPGTAETSETEKLAVQQRQEEEAAARRKEEGKDASETEKVAKVQAAQEAGATAPVDAPAGSATARDAQA